MPKGLTQEGAIRTATQSSMRRRALVSHSQARRRGVRALMADAGPDAGLLWPFRLKDELAALACAKSFADKREAMKDIVARSDGDQSKARRALAGFYLAEEHRDGAGNVRCPRF